MIGGSQLGDQLESNRGFGEQTFRSMGLQTASSYSFSSYVDAIRFLQLQQGRYVLKFNGANSARPRNYIGQLDNSADMIALLTMYVTKAPDEVEPDFLLMQYLQGVEVGIGAYFNDSEFMGSLCIDFEHMRFFFGDLGELTGEMGTVASYRGAGKLFKVALAPLAGKLAQSDYCGYINSN